MRKSRKQKRQDLHSLKTVKPREEVGDSKDESEDESDSDSDSDSESGSGSDSDGENEDNNDIKHQTEEKKSKSQNRSPSDKSAEITIPVEQTKPTEVAKKSPRRVKLIDVVKDELIMERDRGHSRKDAIANVCTKLKVSKKPVYHLALEIPWNSKST